MVDNLVWDSKVSVIEDFTYATYFVSRIIITQKIINVMVRWNKLRCILKKKR